MDDDLDEISRLVDEADELFETPGREEEALQTYLAAARRLSFADDEEARVLRLYAANSIVIAHDVCGRPDEAFAVASRLVDTELDTAPLVSAVSVVNSAFLVAKRHAADGQRDLALGVLERVLARFGGEEEVEDRHWIVGDANLLSGLWLEDLGRGEEALDRYERAIAALRDAEGDEERNALGEALASKASVLADLGRVQDAEAALRAIVDGFASAEAGGGAEYVAWADWRLGNLLFDSRAHVPRTGAGWTGRGAAFHRSVGRGAEAEAAYRKAIELGHGDAWLWLGVLLTSVPRRRVEGEGALRRALRSDDSSIVAQAALKLALLCDLRGEGDEARRLLTLAGEHDVDETGAAASRQLGFLAASAGDRRGAEPAMRALYVERATAAKLEGPDIDADWGTRMTTDLVAGRLTRGPLRAVRHASLRLRMWLVGVRTSSRPARWLGRLQALRR